MSTKELRELEAWIAVNIFGWLYGLGKSGKQCFWPPDCDSEKKRNKWIYGISVPTYTTNFTATLEVLKKCRELAAQKFKCGIHTETLSHGIVYSLAGDNKEFWTVAENEGEAICLFAKKLFEP